MPVLLTGGLVDDELINLASSRLKRTVEIPELPLKSKEAIQVTRFAVNLGLYLGIWSLSDKNIKISGDRDPVAIDLLRPENIQHYRFNSR